MKTSATSPEGKRLHRSAQTGADQTKTRINPAAEARNRAQFVRQTPEQDTVCQKGLINAQNSSIVEEWAFYLGNAGLRPHFLGNIGLLLRWIVKALFTDFFARGASDLFCRFVCWWRRASLRMKASTAVRCAGTMANFIPFKTCLPNLPPATAFGLIQVVNSHLCLVFAIRGSMCTG